MFRIASVMRNPRAFGVAGGRASHACVFDFGSSLAARLRPAMQRFSAMAGAGGYFFRGKTVR